MSDTTNKPDTAVEREAMFGVLPVMAREKLYGFLDAFLVLSGYCIATWSYTQGSYLATLVGFRQLLIGAFKEAADETFIIPACDSALAPVLSIVPAQLFAYYCAVLGGNDPDKPRNLAKSVTVE